jgi:hypothetical protein
MTVARRRSFGSTPEVHRRSATDAGQEARRTLSDVRFAIKSGNCPRAATAITGAFWRLGESHGHAVSYRSAFKSARRSTKYGLQLLRLRKRFVAACVVTRH